MERSDQGIPIHLWVYNHALLGVSDQIDFFVMIMRQHGYHVSVSRRPRVDALNVVIENFSETTGRELNDFCARTGKKVAVIMTEHLDLVGDTLLIHGEPLWNQNDYMEPETQVARVKNLMACLPSMRAFLVLGDLPELLGSDRMFPGLRIGTLPFPRLARVELGGSDPKFELVFTGALTLFREQMMKAMKARLSLVHPMRFVSRAQRDGFNASARIVLNLPQRSDWRWLSLMRVIAALRCGRATVSIGTQDQSVIAACCVQLALGDWEERLGELIENWRDAYESAFQRYEAMRLDFLDAHGFPDDLFTYWALIEHIEPSDATR